MVEYRRTFMAGMDEVNIVNFDRALAPKKQIRLGLILLKENPDINRFKYLHIVI